MGRHIAKLRPHHLLCLHLFDGRGYDGAFIENMRRIRDGLTVESGAFILSAERDDICAACPNMNAQGSCALGESDAGRMDRAAMNFLKLDDHTPYVYRDITEKLKGAITPALYASCCGSCRWHKEGFCTYEKLMERLSL